MNLTVTSKNLYLFLPSKVSRIAMFITEDKHCNVVDAIKEFYSSKTYKLLENETTKEWHKGAVALYEEFRNS